METRSSSKRRKMSGSIERKRSKSVLVIDDNETEKHEGKKQNDLPGIILLIILYVLQGIPLGLSMGSVPFLLKKKLGYAELAIFSLTGYPYSLKLLWSPIVDSVFFARIGRRKSWIVPTQFAVGLFLLWISAVIDDILVADTVDVYFLTFLFFGLVLLSATQDIAVDGWALEMLSTENLSFASTAQSIGLNIGYFLSFSVFLVFNSADFCNSWLRSEPQPHGLISLGSYMFFWSICFFVVTLWLLLFKDEKPPSHTDSVYQAYKDIFNVLQLSDMKQLAFVLLISKIGYVTADLVTGYKLIENGFKEEQMGLIVFIDFPLSLLFGYYAAKWSSGENKLLPWMIAYFIRLLLVFLTCLAVWTTEGNPSFNGLIFVMACSVVRTFMGTIQFVSMGAFFTNIADPTIGGTYMTLLNTISNLGGIYPQYFILKFVDYFGYYNVAMSLATLGIVLGMFVIRPRVSHLQSVPISFWRIG